MDDGAQLNGKVALITGGGTGIGRAIAEAYARAGASVAVIGRRSEPLAAVVEGIEAAAGKAMLVRADVTSLEAMEGAARATVDRFGRLDIVVANAGSVMPFVPTLETTPEVWQEILDVYLTGVWNTAKATVPFLVDAGGGAIVMMGSIRSRANAGGLGAFSAAKAGVSALTRVLAFELRSSNIAVNEIMPGPTRTSLGGDEAEHQAERTAASGEWLKDPDEVARLALYLATLPPNGTTGQVFNLAAKPS